MGTLVGSAAQLEALDALCQHGTVKEAADARGVSRWAIEARIKRLRARNRDATTVQLAWQRGRDSAVVQMRLWLDSEAA